MRMNCKCRSCCSTNIVTNSNDLEKLCDNVKCGCSNMNDSCSCGFNEDSNSLPENPVLAQSYVPIQELNEVFLPCVGLENGTIFPELVSPYRPNQSIDEINYIKSTNSIGEGCNKC